MRAVIRILIGAVYGYVCYVTILWLVATAVPRLGLSGENMEAALYWPKNIYLYFLPRQWAETPTSESLLTIGGALLILRGMVAAAKKVARGRIPPESATPRRFAA